MLGLVRTELHLNRRTLPPPLSASRRVGQRFKDCYKVGETLGKGGFAVVKRVVERSTGRAYAVKIMSLPPVGAEPTDNESTR
jgi:serine/threonine protein kinase